MRGGRYSTLFVVPVFYSFIQPAPSRNEKRRVKAGLEPVPVRWGRWAHALAQILLAFLAPYGCARPGYRFISSTATAGVPGNDGGIPARDQPLPRVLTPGPLSLGRGGTQTKPAVSSDYWDQGRHHADSPGPRGCCAVIRSSVRRGNGSATPARIACASVLDSDALGDAPGGYYCRGCPARAPRRNRRLPDQERMAPAPTPPGPGRFWRHPPPPSMRGARWRT